ncbi:MAG: PhzF family phenazine biosynthesis protein [Pseudomonadales bacterium]
METHIVDVFAETALAGNQLAVILDAAHLSTQQMQAIAAETNFSETTFVTKHGEDSAAVRIFTPSDELPFAGHPTIGTAWVLAQHKAKQASITLHLGVGDVKVEFDDQTNIGWLQSPTAEFDAGISAEYAAELLGIDATELNPGFPIRGAHLGPSFQIIAVNSLSVLNRCRIDSNLFVEFQKRSERVDSLFVFTPHGHSDNANYAARMFFDANGPREDPATGSANCCFAAYLLALSDDQDSGVNVIVDQGVEMGRPSKIYIEASSSGIRVGGKVQHVFEGQFTA